MAPTNWDNLVRDTLAPIFRQSRWLAWLRALIGAVVVTPSSIYLLYTELLAFREFCLRRASTTGEVIRLEIQLNRVFIGSWSPTVTPPITVLRQAPAPAIVWGRRVDARPVVMGRRIDSRSVVMGRRADTVALQAGLTIRCPISLQPRSAEIIAEVERYMPAAVTYTLVFY